MWKADIITFLPEVWPGVLGSGLVGKALEKKSWSLRAHSVYDFAPENVKGRVDGKLAGGGGGMALRADIAAKALDELEYADRKAGVPPRKKIYLSPLGEVFSQKTALRWSKESGLIAVCGRYEGIDWRFSEMRDAEPVSLGDFILCGGDVAAMTIIEATVRLLPGTVGNADCLVNESFTQDLLEEPQYTLPQIWEGAEIPPVLLSGDHKKIAEWRRARSETVTFEKRPDLWKKYCAETRFKKLYKS